MSEKISTVGWVRTTIPKKCQENARYVAGRHGMTLEETYRYFLTFCLWEDDPENVSLWLAELRGVELDDVEARRE